MIVASDDLEHALRNRRLSDDLVIRESDAARRFDEWTMRIITEVGAVRVNSDSRVYVTIS